MLPVSGEATPFVATACALVGTVKGQTWLASMLSASRLGTKLFLAWRHPWIRASAFGMEFQLRCGKRACAPSSEMGSR